MYEIGTRVVAIQKADENTVWTYGEGIYQGDNPCPKFHDIKNPEIKLDQGGTVWGMECWWGPADRMNERFSGRDQIIVSPSEEEPNNE